MTTTVFSTIDRFANRFKLVDSLIDTVAARLLPQQEAKGYSCPANYPYYCNEWACGDYCNPREDYMYTIYFCGNVPNCANGIAYMYQPDCLCK